MAVVLFVLFLAVPFVELAVIVGVADAIGLPLTILTLVLFSVAGAMLLRRQGWAVWQRANAELAAGRMPAKEMLDGAMVLLGGALLLTPGFVTDALGLALMLPPVRAVLRPLLLSALTRRAARRVTAVRFVDLGGAGFTGGVGGAGFGPAPGTPGPADGGPRWESRSSSRSYARVVDVDIADAPASPQELDPPSTPGASSE